MTAFLGIYKALYDYEPQTPEELAIKEDDLLYLLEKSEVDDWWTVKKRVIGSDAEEPVGLVPSNYVEPATVILKVKALYGYEQAQNPDEELIFHENEQFDVFDDKDPDWLLVQSQSTKECGFVPGNYMEPIGGESTSVPAPAPGEVANAPSMAPLAAPQAQENGPIPIAAPLPTPVTAFQPPPQHPSKTPSESPAPLGEEVPSMPKRDAQAEDRYSNYRAEEEEEAPPPKPTRPVSSNLDSSRERARNRVSYNTDQNEDYSRFDRNGSRGNDEITGTDSYEDRGMNSEYHTWNISEVDGRKKRKCKLSIGNNRIYFQPQKGTPEEWTIDKLTSYDNEKKHMFLEFIDPYKSLELHTGNNDTCKEIMSIIGEFKGASRDPGLREVEMASKTKKQGTVLYDFIAESQDELSVKQGQSVYILNDRKSRDWWMCEVIATGKRGVVPAQFIEPSKDKTASGGGLLNSIKKFTKSSKSPSKATGGGSWRDDEEQDVAGSESRNRNKSKSTSERKKRSASASSKTEFPDPKKTRIWADRSGTFKVDAQFIGCSDGKIHLHKANGVKIAVAAEKLSDDDIIYVERATGFSLDKYKVKKSESKDARESERDRRRKLREQDERERDRKLRERELEELRKARDLLDQERAKLQEKELPPPAKPPRPQSTGGQLLTASTTGNAASVSKNESRPNYDWFEFFLNSGVDVSNCQRYTINFEREQITEDMMKDINPAMLRTLGLREGDIVRVTKYLDQKFGREAQLQPQVGSTTGGMFSEPDGSLRVSPINNNNTSGPTVAQTLLPQKTAPALSSFAADDDAWTVKPAAKSEVNLPSSKSEFTGSMQDLLDLQPLEPKKKPVVEAPEPNLKDLQPVKTGTSAKAPISSVPTGGTTLMPLDPFKTGGHNLLPVATGFMMMPIATGGLMPIQRTGGFVMPQTTFGVPNTGSLLQPQRTSGTVLPISTTGGFMPQTSFGIPAGSALPLQRTGGALPMSNTGGIMNAPPLGSVLPLQKTATGILPANLTGGVLPMQRTGGALPLQTTGGLLPLQRTGGAIPQTSFGTSSQLANAGSYMPSTSFGNLTMGNSMMPQSNITGSMPGGINILPQTTFANQVTGGANVLPQSNISNLTGGGNIVPGISNNYTGGPSFVPGTSFGNNMTGGANMNSQMPFGNQVVSGMPQTSFNGPQITGGLMPMQRTGGFPQAQALPQITGGFQQNMQFGQNTGVPQYQNTGQPMQQYTGQPMQQFSNVNTVTQGLQNTSISQPALQTQPTGFGFGNGPQQQFQQQPQQQPRQANLFNASADNPFGF